MGFKFVTVLRKESEQDRWHIFFLFGMTWTMEVVLLVTTATSRPCLINPYSIVMARAFVLSQQKEYKCHSKYMYIYVYILFLEILFFFLLSGCNQPHVVSPYLLSLFWWYFLWFDTPSYWLLAPSAHDSACSSGSELHCNLQAPTLKSNGHKRIDAGDPTQSHTDTANSCVRLYITGGLITVRSDSWWTDKANIGRTDKTNKKC